MKTSDKLLLGLAAVLLAGLVATGFALKVEYESVKAKPRPQEGFRFVPTVPAFSHVKVNSLSPGIRFYIQQGSRAVVQVNNNLADRIKTRVQNDTLFVDLPERIIVRKTEDNPAGEQIGMSVTFAKLASVTFVNGLGSVSGWKTGTGRIELQNRSRVNSYRDKMENLYVVTHGQSVFTLEDNTEIKKFYPIKSDSSKIWVEGVSVEPVQGQK
jgi:hypothetical protein